LIIQPFKEKNMSSFSIQAIKDTLQGIQGTISSKITPAVGTFLGKSFTFISANPLTAVAVVAAVITVSLVVFAVYKHYQYHKQLKAENAFLKNTEKLAFVDLKKENKKITALVKEKEILESENRDLASLSAILQNEKKYYKNEKKIIKNESDLLINDLKEVRAELDTAVKVGCEMDDKIAHLEKTIIDNEEKALTIEEQDFSIIESLDKEIQSLKEQLLAK